MRYAKYRWNETRGDEHSDWGASWWLFEFDVDGTILRQVELYDRGVRTRYSQQHQEDEFGRMTYGSIHDFDREPDHRLSADEFEAEWRTGPWVNE